MTSEVVILLMTFLNVIKTHIIDVLADRIDVMLINRRVKCKFKRKMMSLKFNHKFKNLRAT